MADDAPEPIRSTPDDPSPGDDRVAPDRPVVDAPGPADHCPLLVLDGNAMGVAAEGPLGSRGTPGSDVANRCAASDPAAPVSLAQQRLVCLDVDHIHCPRFVRATGSPRMGGVGRPARAVSPGVRAASTTVGIVAIEAQSTGTSLGGRPGIVEAAGGSEAPGGSEAAGGASAGDASKTAGRAAAAAAQGGPAITGAPVTSAAPGPVVAAEEAPAESRPAAASVTPPVPVRPIIRSRRRSGARPARSRPTPLFVAGGILAVAVVAVLVFTTLRGGISLPSQAPGSAPASVALTTASPTLSPTTSPSPTPTASLTPSPSPTPTASPSPSPTPSPSPSLPAAYQGLRPCPDSPACYLYRVHAGDSLTAIAIRFGVSLQALKAANPAIKDPSLLHVGDILRIPLP